MRVVRRCTRSGCSGPAVATLTYAYADLTAVVGPLASFAEPHADDLEALADAVREAARVEPPIPGDDEPGTGRRGHLRIVPSVR